MALSFADSTGNLFNRLGKIGKIIARNKSSQTSQQTNFTELLNQLLSEPDVQSIVGNSYLSILNGVGNSMAGTLQSYASSIINRMVYRDTPQINQNLTQQNLLASLLNVVQQMKEQAATVLAMTITATPAAPTAGTSFATNMAGNGVLNASTKRPVDGRTLENAFAETLTFACTQDSYEGGATEGNETYSVKGQGSQSDFFAFDWPLGSNCNTSVSAIDGNADNSSGNLLTNTGFSDWTAGALDNWTTVQGGAALAEDTAQSYDGGTCLRFTGDGATNPIITQTFDDSTNGTAGTLDAVTQYSINIWLRRGGTAIASGPTLIIDLVDGNNVVTLDQQGVANSFTVDLSALSTLYQVYRGAFRTPYIVPASFKLRLRYTGSLPSGRIVYADKLSMGTMTQVYRQGPFVALHAGSVPPIVGDYATCAITNSRGSGGSLSTWQLVWAQLFPLAFQNELLLPSGSSPTISDGLITV